MSNRFKRNYRKPFRKEGNHTLLIMFSILLLVGVVIAGIILLRYMKERKNPSVAADDIFIEAYQAKEFIARGQSIFLEQLKPIEIRANMPEENYFTKELIGQIAVADIPADMVLTMNMCRTSDMKDQEREVECEIIALSQNLSENDYVDVRLMLPNGEDYIVLSKKSIHGLNQSEESDRSLCYLWLSEEEILIYSAAAVDAYLYQGASLYTTRYIEPDLQNASQVTYIPSLATLTMMKENPNLLESATKFFGEEERKRMENRLTDYLNKDIREVNWEEASKKEESREEDVIPASAFVDTEKDDLGGMENEGISSASGQFTN